MRTKKRRGIGTVIGTAVMIFLMVFTIGQLYIYSIDELDNYNRAASQVFAIQSQKLNEHLSIQSVTLDTSGSISQDILATLVISNTGGATSQIQDVWFDDADSSTSLHTVVPVSNVFVGRGLSTTLSSLDTGIGYSVVHKIKASVITTLGNSVSTLLLPPGEAGTTAQTLATVSLIVNPPNPITTNDITVILTVTNNNVLGAAFTNLIPDICLVEWPAGTSNPDLQHLENCYQLSVPNPLPSVPYASCDALYSSNPYPVKCTRVPTSNKSPPPAVPLSISFLPYGSTAVFQWTYEVDTLVADQQIMVAAGFASLSKTNFYSSSAQPQVPFQIVTVRNPGGASGNSGGNFLSAVGNLVNYFSSFYASQTAKVWVIGSALTSGSTTVFRMNVTNISPNVIQFNSNTEIVVLDTKTGKDYNFYVVQACTNYMPYYAIDSNCAPNAYPATGYILGPSQTITMYFTATVVGGTTEQKLGTSGESGQSWLATPAFFGSQFNGGGVTLAAGATSTTISVTSVLAGGMTSAFTLILQTGWNTGLITVSPVLGASSCGSGTPTPLGAVTITLSSACGSGFVLSWSTLNPAPTSGPAAPLGTGTCIPSGYSSNSCNQLTWGVYNSNTDLTKGGIAPYGQSSAIFSVRT